MIFVHHYLSNQENNVKSIPPGLTRNFVVFYDTMHRCLVNTGRVPELSSPEIHTSTTGCNQSCSWWMYISTKYFQLSKALVPTYWCMLRLHSRHKDCKQRSNMITSHERNLLLQMSRTEARWSIPVMYYCIVILCGCKSRETCQILIWMAEGDIRFSYSWWRHQIQTFSALLAFYVGNSPVSGDSPPPELWCFLWSVPEEAIE